MRTLPPIPGPIAGLLAMLLLPAGFGSTAAATEAVTAPTPVSVEALFSGTDAASGAALRERVYAEAGGARQRLWMLAYTLTDPGLLRILADKGAEPGFDLRILVDGHEHADALASRTEDAEVGRLLRDLEAAGKLVPVAIEDGRLHTKLILIDQDTLIAGSENWSNLGSQAKWNDLVVVRDPKGGAIAACEAGFAAIPEASRFGAARRRKPERTARPGPVGQASAAHLALALSAPGGARSAARDQLLTLVRQARRRIKLAQFTLTDPDLVQALVDAGARGVEVEVVVDRIQHANLDQRTGNAARVLRERLGRLAERGALRASAGSSQLHHKLAVIDDVVVTGSANWTPSAWTENHELVLFLSAPPRTAAALVDPYLARHADLWGAASR